MLTQKAKILMGVLLFLFFVSTGLSIYYGIQANKNCPGGDPKANPPTLKGFNVQSTSRPWSVSTWYKYSYVDINNSKEGSQSGASDAVQSETQTNPIIQLDIDTNKYNVKVYRSITTEDGEYEPIQVTITTDGTFVDTDNPAPDPPSDTPPTPTRVPSLTGWKGGGGDDPGCPSGSTKCSNTYCTKEQEGVCTNAAAPWSCFEGNIGSCADDPTHLETQQKCTQYCKVQHDPP